jgi:hypothetical protein
VGPTIEVKAKGRKRSKKCDKDRKRGKEMGRKRTKKKRGV